jgi:16S rRNA processing protein RimM
MVWSEMAVVGRIARPHGLRGHVFVNSETDFPEQRFQPGAEVFVERQGAVEALTLAAVRVHQGRPIIAIVGVDRIEDAQALAGLELRVPADHLVELPEGMFYRHDLIGCRVETVGGDLVGIVKQVEGSNTLSRLVVVAAEAEEDEILIPLAAPICTVIDAPGKRIVIDPPAGLLELNRRSR